MDQKYNCFNFIRLYACINVLLFHMGSSMNYKIPFLNSLVNPINGVPVFFLLSGFLIWLSLDRNFKFKHFYTKRILRLFPELWISIAIEFVFLLSLYSGPNITDYLQILLFQGLTLSPYTPNAFKYYGIGSLNPSLWTIPIIIQFYIIIWFVYRWLKKKSLITWIIILSFLIGTSALFTANIQRNMPHYIQSLIGISACYYLWIFFIGCFIAKYFYKLVPILTKFWYISLISLIIIEMYPLPTKSIVPYSFSGIILLALSVFGLGYKFPKIRIETDISYAVYLYHMIFANALIHLGYKGNGYAVAIIIFTTFISAYISTLFITNLLHRQKTVS